MEMVESWQKKSGKNANGGLNQHGRDSYNHNHGGICAHRASVTNRFCARMKGMKKHLTSSKTVHDPNSRVNKSRGLGVVIKGIKNKIIQEECFARQIC